MFNEYKYCTKCGKKIKKNDKYDVCEACRNKKVGKMNRVAKIGASILGCFAVVVGINNKLH